MKKIILVIIVLFIVTAASAEIIETKPEIDNDIVNKMRKGDIVYQYFSPDKITFSEDGEEIHHYDGDKKLVVEWIYKEDNQYLVKYYGKDSTTQGECHYKVSNPNIIPKAYVRGAFQPEEVGIQKHGSCTLYNLDGTIFVDEFYAEGKLLDDNKQLYNGIYKIYEKDRNAVTETSYKDGIEHGVSKTYKDGNLIIESEYKDGKLDGYRKIYDEKGVLRSEVQWRNGEIVFGER